MQVLIQILEIKEFKLIIILNLGEANMLGKKKEFTSGLYIFTIYCFFLVECNMIDVLNKIPILLIVEDDPKIYKETMISRNVSF
jgi:hypothetical protein